MMRVVLFGHLPPWEQPGVFCPTIRPGGRAASRMEIQGSLPGRRCRPAQTHTTPAEHFCLPQTVPWEHGRALNHALEHAVHVAHGRSQDVEALGCSFLASFKRAIQALVNRTVLPACCLRHLGPFPQSAEFLEEIC